MPISDQLREAVKQSGLSLCQIAKATGVAQPMLSRFMSGDATRNDIRLERTANKLATFFKLGLAPLPDKAKSKRKSPTASRPRRPKKKRTGE